MNEKNRLNPTEPCDKWNEKMLLEIGADPLAVIRDFPRMVVYVNTGVHHNYLPPGADGRPASPPMKRGSPSASPNPLQQDPKASKAGKPTADGAPASHGKTKRVSVTSSTAAPAGTTAVPMVTSSPSVDSAMDGASREERLRATVLLLAELCDEKESYGARFDEAVTRLHEELLHAERSATLGTDEGAAVGAGSSAFRSSRPGDSLPPPGSNRTPNRHSVITVNRQHSAVAAGVADIHQLFLSACVESGMLAPVYAADEVPASRASRLGSVMPGASLPLSYGAVDQCNQSTMNANASTNNGNGNASSMTTRRVSTYNVCSATFHLMQYMVQGVMFFPVQRLKHVLWMDWSSHFEDGDWAIHVFLEEADANQLKAMKHRRTTRLSLENEDGAALGANQLSNMPDSRLARGSTVVGAADTSALQQPQAGTASTQSDKRQMIVVKHVQSGRHYVEEGQRKDVPRYELEWACNMYVDQRILQEHYFNVNGKTCPSASAASLITPSTDAALASSPLDMLTLPRPIREREASNISEGSTHRGVRVADQVELVKKEVLLACLDVVAARVEHPPKSFCRVSSTWKQRRDELEFVLQEQYHVPLDEVPELKPKRRTPFNA